MSTPIQMLIEHVQIQCSWPVGCEFNWSGGGLGQLRASMALCLCLTFPVHAYNIKSQIIEKQKDSHIFKISLIK